VAQALYSTGHRVLRGNSSSGILKCLGSFMGRFPVKPLTFPRDWPLEQSQPPRSNIFPHSRSFCLPFAERSANLRI